MLIRTNQERLQRAQDKQRAILQFLRDETWTHVSNIQLLLGTNYLVAHRALTRMQQCCLVKSERFLGLGGQIRLWGITSHGLAMAYDSEESIVQRPYFDRSKVTLSTVHHTLDLQRARLKASQAGWQDWLNGRYLEEIELNKRPDAVAVSPQGHKVAIEVERTIKTRKRYEQVMSVYLQAIRRQAFDYVVYLAPQGTVSHLERFFRQITEIPVAGQRIAVTDKHHEKFAFYSLEQWPPVSECC